jgi:hypothetical protein
MRWIPLSLTAFAVISACTRRRPPERITHFPRGSDTEAIVRHGDTTITITRGTPVTVTSDSTRCAALPRDLQRTVSPWTPDSTCRVWSEGIEWHETLVLRNGRHVDTPVHHVAFLALLPTEHRAPYLIIQGEPCAGECDVGGPEIDIESPDDPVHDTTGYEGPGTNWSEEPGDTLPWAIDRVFFGHCLPDSALVMVWYAQHRGRTGAMESLVHVVSVANDKLLVRDLMPPLPDVDQTLARVQAGACREIT